MRRIFIQASIVLFMLTTVAFAETKFTSTWKAPDAAGASFAAKKVVALVISDDDDVRMSGEEELARQLAQRGIQSVAAYRMIPREELKDPAKARGWFERSGIQGVVAMRPVAQEKERSYVPVVWTSYNYASFWGYYPYSWGTLSTAGYTRTDTIVVIETLIYDITRDKLLWAGVSRTTNPKTLQKSLEELIKEAGKEMKKQGLVRK